MPILTFAASVDGLAVDVLIGPSRAQLQAFRIAGRPVPQPVPLRALIDSGADFTSTVDVAVASLGLLPLGPFAVNTANGRTIVNRYAVGFTLLDPDGSGIRNFVRPNLPVLGMSDAPIGFDVIVGMDLLKDWLLVHDGPANRFTLAF